jgi:hypothetical protein
MLLRNFNISKQEHIELECLLYLSGGVRQDKYGDRAGDSQPHFADSIPGMAVII